MSVVRQTPETNEDAIQPAQGNQDTQQVQGKAAKRPSRPHIYELDPVRTITAYCVIAVHVLAFTFFLEHTNTSTLLHSAVLNAFHFTRQVFMFVTAFALIYVYYGKPFSTTRFYLKRSMGVLLPYSIWSVIYTWVNTPKPLWPFVQTSIFNILTGSASYQLYYILLTLQFYLVLPLFMLLLKRLEHHPWKTLGISFACQLVFLYLDYRYVQTGPFSTTPLGNMLVTYQDRIILVYQFFFFLGAFAALHLNHVRDFMLRYGWFVVGVFLVTAGWLWGHFFLQTLVYHQDQGYALSVLQPSIDLYSTGVIALFFWLAALWARRTGAKGYPAGSRVWGKLSDASFGVYLVHVLILNNFVLASIAPMMPSSWPSFVIILLSWMLTVAFSVLMSSLLLQIPFASRLVGRAHPEEHNMLHALRRWREDKASTNKLV